MFNRMNFNNWSRRITLSFSTLAAMILVAVLVACGDEAPTGAPGISTQAPAAVSTTPVPTAAASTPAPATEIPTVEAASEPGETPPPTAAPTEEPETSETPAPTVAPTEEPETVEPTTTPTETAAVDPVLAAASEDVHALVVKLSEELGHREGGTPEELHAAEHLKEMFDSLGYSAELQSFSYEFFDIAGFAKGKRDLAAVAIVEPVETMVPGIPISSKPNGEMNSGPLRMVDPSDEAALSEGRLEGQIAFLWFDEIKLGNPAVVQGLQDQVNLVANAGAVAAVISSSAMNFQGYQPLFGVESPIPALLVPPEAGDLMLGSVTNGPPFVVSVQIQVEKLESQNVTAELKGEGDFVVVVGAHYDVVPQTESGPNDNTSGTAIVLSLAKALAGESLPITVRFVLFGAEEQGSAQRNKDFMAAFTTSHPSTNRKSPG